jgi:hypothetical protein
MKNEVRDTHLIGKVNNIMETNSDGTFFQEGDHVRIKRTGEQGRVNATDGGVVYVVMDETRASKIFSAAVDEDATIELILLEKQPVNGAR